MKITIQHYDTTTSLEMEDDCDIDEFADSLRVMLSIHWHPDLVSEIMPNDEEYERLRRKENCLRCGPYKLSKQ